jgi:hypothetical protein
VDVSSASRWWRYSNFGLFGFGPNITPLRRTHGKGFSVRDLKNIVPRESHCRLRVSRLALARHIFSTFPSNKTIRRALTIFTMFFLVLLLFSISQAVFGRPLVEGTSGCIRGRDKVDIDACRRVVKNWPTGKCLPSAKQ